MAQRYGWTMATDAAARAYARDLAEVDEVAAEVEHARIALAAAEAKAAKIVAKALKSCLAAGRNRTEVQKHSPFSPPTVRKIGEDAGIPPDERYVRTTRASES